MRALNKEQISSDSRPLSAGQGWQMFTLQPSNDEGMSGFEGSDFKEIRAALHQAEVVIRAQEERIRNLESMALTDELTGLANRRGFGFAFEHELALARRDANYGGVLIMIDLDGFKAINDKWGHQAVDAYLCAVAETLRIDLRASDTVARLGGDEFALLLTHMDEANGVKRVAKLEKAFGKRAVLSERIPLCASFGMAAYTGASSAEAVTQIADLRLYAHKSRNKK
jgi:diguanylate cyclase (GGDEF)-like protein